MEKSPLPRIVAPMPHILEECRQVAHHLFQSATESSFANMIDVVARLYSLFEGKDRRCNNHEGDVVVIMQALERAAEPRQLASFTLT